MAYQAGTGLVTNKNEALLLLACTAEVEVCEDCFTLGGGDARIKYLAPLEGHNSTYHVVLGWDCEYRGPVTLETARCAQASINPSVFLLYLLRVKVH